MNPEAYELYEEIKEYILIDINGNVTIKEPVPIDIKNKIEEFIDLYEVQE